VASILSLHLNLFLSLTRLVLLLLSRYLLMCYCHLEILLLLVSCALCRPPGPCSAIKGYRSKIFLAVDFNINLLNRDSHCETDAFLNICIKIDVRLLLIVLPDFQIIDLH